MNYRREYEYYKKECENLEHWLKQVVEEYEHLLLYTEVNCLGDVSYRQDDINFWAIKTRDCICYAELRTADRVRDLDLPSKYLFAAAGKLYDISNAPYKDAEDF